MSNPVLESIIKQAKAAYQAGDFPAAILGFKEARETALASGDEPLAAEMANNLSVTYLQNKQPQEALTAVQGTDLVFEANGDITKQGIALGNIGTALEELKQFDEALEYYRRSIELLREAGETEYRSMVQKSLAAIQIRQGNHVQGLVSMQQSLDGQKKLSPRERFLKRLLKIPFKLFGR